MEMCASAPRLTNVAAPSDTPSRAGEVSAAEGETVDVTVRPSLRQSLPTPVTSATSSLLRAPPHVTAQTPEAASARASVDAAVAHEPQPPADEVVQVFHNDGVVAIVIRDLALGDDVALRCALETARQLAGDPRALRQVTLNGRSIFRSADRTGATPAHRQPLVSFTC